MSPVWNKKPIKSSVLKRSIYVITRIDENNHRIDLKEEYLKVDFLKATNCKLKHAEANLEG